MPSGDRNYHYCPLHSLLRILHEALVALPSLGDVSKTASCRREVEEGVGGKLYSHVNAMEQVCLCCNLVHHIFMLFPALTQTRIVAKIGLGG